MKSETKAKTPRMAGNRASAKNPRPTGPVASASGLVARGSPANRRAADRRARSPLVAIRAKCTDCSCGSARAIRFCTMDGVNSTWCDLWPFRFGLRPATARRRYGPQFVTPGVLPDASVNLDDCRAATADKVFRISQTAPDREGAIPPTGNSPAGDHPPRSWIGGAERADRPARQT